MCTCIAYRHPGLFFGRNMDLDYAFGQRVVITPRRYLLEGKAEAWRTRYAMIGIGAAEGGWPLYAEAVNEKGLCMAGLNFPGNAVYPPPAAGMRNLAPYALIPYVLGQCGTAAEARQALADVNLIPAPFRPDLPLPTLHWMLADGRDCLVLEPLAQGLQIYDNPAEVLANNPPFPYHLENLKNYRNLTADFPPDRFSLGLPLEAYGVGLGGLGLPGDASSASRFVRAAFLRWNASCPPEPLAAVTQVFHMLDALAMVRGSVRTAEGSWDMTTYACCMDAQRGLYYYKTYENNRLQAVSLREENLDGKELVCYELENTQQVGWVNRKA